MSAEFILNDSPVEPILPDESTLTLSERYQHTRIGEIPERWVADRPDALVIEIEHLRALKPDAAHALRFVASFGLSPEQSDIFTLLMHATEDHPLAHNSVTSHILSPDRSMWNEYDSRRVSGEIMQVIGVIRQITHSQEAVVSCDTWQNDEYDHAWYLHPSVQIVDTRAKETTAAPPPTAVDVPAPRPELVVAPEPSATILQKKTRPQSAPTRRVIQPTKQRLSLLRESDIIPSTQKKRLPLQVVQESLTMEERAAVYTAHCLGRLVTDDMVQAGLHLPEQVYKIWGVENRAQLIEHVQATIMPKVRNEIAQVAQANEAQGMSLETFTGMLREVLGHNR